MNEEQSKLLKAALDKQAHAERAIAQVKQMRETVRTLNGLEAEACCAANRASEDAREAFVAFEKAIGLKREVLGFAYAHGC